MKRHIWLIAAASGLVLAGCFGDDDNTPAAAPAPFFAAPPASASVDSAGLVAYVQSLIASTAQDTAQADMQEPADIGAVTLSTRETEEPKDI